MLRILGSAVCGLALSLTGCVMAPLDDATNIKMAVEAQPIRLEAEQVVLTPRQVDCGTREDLWEPPAQGSESRQSARLMTGGKALHFDDDVSVTETGYAQPYVQVRGEFPVVVEEVIHVRNGSGANSRIAQVKASVTVAHSCFARPLPLMGVRNGKFHQDISPTVELRVEGETWKFERVLH